MQWRLSLAVPVLLALCVPSIANAQDSVPLTITIPKSNHGITRVTFPEVSPDTFEVSETLQSGAERLQHFVGYVNLDRADNRYRFETEYFMGGSPIPQGGPSSYGPDDACVEPDLESWIERIACSVVEKGAGVTCVAFYQNADRPLQGEPCEGTQACKRCNGIKVCSSDPECY